MKYLADFTVLVLLYGLVFFRKWKARGNDVLLINTLMYVYLSLVLYVTLMPIIPALPFVFDHPYAPMNFVPFIDVLEGRGDFLRQVALNVIMTMPFGFLFPLAQRKPAGFGRTVWVCLWMSLGIEVLQPLLHDSRSSDVTDLVTNVIGGAVGYGFYVVFKPAVSRILVPLQTEK